MFDALASVIELDQSGLDALIQNVEDELGVELTLKRNFLKLIDETLGKGELSTNRRKILHTAAGVISGASIKIERCPDGR